MSYNNHNLTREELCRYGYREYRGQELNIYYRRDLCRHAAHCVHGDNKVFDVSQKPWIQPDRGETGELKRIIDECPSGALKYLADEE